MLGWGEDAFYSPIIRSQSASESLLWTVNFTGASQIPVPCSPYILGEQDGQSRLELGISLLPDQLGFDEISKKVFLEVRFFYEEQNAFVYFKMFISTLIWLEALRASFL